jgi:superfamily II DNA/RNA helicase
MVSGQFSLKSESVNLAALLGGVACHSDMTPQHVNDVLKELRDGSTRIVVSTTILGVALNVPSISDVIHFGYPWDFLSYIQESIEQDAFVTKWPGLPS